MALIELDLYAPPEIPTGRPPPSARRRAAGLGAALVLLLALAGSTPGTAVLWQRMGVASIAGPTGSFAIVAGRLYTFDSAGGRLITTAWSMRPLRRLWSRIRPLGAPGDYPAEPGLGWSITAAGAGAVLLQSERSSTLIDAATGAVRWTLPEVVRPLDGGRVGLVHRQQFRPGAEYDETLGAQGPLYFGDDGAFHTEPPVQTTVLGVDLRTGRTRWRSVLAGPAVAVSAPGEPAAALVVASDRLRLVDAATGAVLRERRLAGPAPRDLSEGDVGNGLVLVRHGAPVGGGTVTAYSARTLALLWRRPMLVDGGPAFCDTVLCEYEPRGVTVLDPATGLPRWRTDADVGLVPRAGDVIEVAHRVTRPLRVRDAVTGAVRADLGRWTYAAAGPPDVPLVVAQFAGARSAFGVLPPGGRAVQPLGYSSTPVTDCASDQRFLVCRVVDGAEVWAYLPVRNPGRRG